MFGTPEQARIKIVCCFQHRAMEHIESSFGVDGVQLWKPHLKQFIMAHRMDYDGSLICLCRMLYDKNDNPNIGQHSYPNSVCSCGHWKGC